ncbi:MAG: SUMF1/EgtB/PvdO family nonheme iron enzyme [Planctomycetaceae bacterium]|jgi:formylglycine-generating enzyme required for sulfatase activity
MGNGRICLSGLDPLVAQASHRVRRGGGWRYSFPSHCRSAYRGWDSPDLRYNFFGFRVARSPVR